MRHGYIVVAILCGLLLLAGCATEHTLYPMVSEETSLSNPDKCHSLEEGKYLLLLGEKEGNNAYVLDIKYIASNCTYQVNATDSHNETQSFKARMFRVKPDVDYVSVTLSEAARSAMLASVSELEAMLFVAVTHINARIEHAAGGYDVWVKKSENGHYSSADSAELLAEAMKDDISGYRQAGKLVKIPRMLELGKVSP